MEISVEDPTTGAKYLTNPARDIAFFAPQILEDVAARCSADRLTDLDLQLIRQLPGVTARDVGRAWEALAKFHGLAIDPDVTTVPAAIAASGFSRHHPMVQQLVLAKYAQALVGAVWAGLRSSAMSGMCPPVITNLRRRADEAAASFDAAAGTPARD